MVQRALICCLLGVLSSIEISAAVDLNVTLRASNVSVEFTGTSQTPITCSRFLNHVENVFKDTSLSLYKISNHRNSTTYFDTIDIIVPPSWNTSQCGNRRFVDSPSVRSDVRVGGTRPIFGDKPQTSPGCRTSGDYISLATSYFIDNATSDFEKSRTLLHQWAVYRYGLHDKLCRQTEKELCSSIRQASDDTSPFRDCEDDACIDDGVLEMNGTNGTEWKPPVFTYKKRVSPKVVVARANVETDPLWEEFRRVASSMAGEVDVNIELGFLGYGFGYPKNVENVALKKLDQVDEIFESHGDLAACLACAVELAAGVLEAGGSSAANHALLFVATNSSSHSLDMNTAVELAKKRQIRVHVLSLGMTSVSQKVASAALAQLTGGSYFDDPTGSIASIKEAVRSLFQSMGVPVQIPITRPTLNLKMHSFADCNNRNRTSLIVQAALLYDDSPVIGASVQARISTFASPWRTEVLDLLDDGDSANMDVRNDDGVYSAYVGDFAEPSIVVLTADGSNGTTGILSAKNATSSWSRSNAVDDSYQSVKMDPFYVRVTEIANADIDQLKAFLARRIDPTAETVVVARIRTSSTTTSTRMTSTTSSTTNPSTTTFTTTSTTTPTTMSTTIPTTILTTIPATILTTNPTATTPTTIPVTNPTTTSTTPTTASTAASTTIPATNPTITSTTLTTTSTTTSTAASMTTPVWTSTTIPTTTTSTTTPKATTSTTIPTTTRNTTTPTTKTLTSTSTTTSTASSTTNPTTLPATNPTTTTSTFPTTNLTTTSTTTSTTNPTTTTSATTTTTNLPTTSTTLSTTTTSATTTSTNPMTTSISTATTISTTVSATSPTTTAISAQTKSLEPNRLKKNTTTWKSTMTASSMSTDLVAPRSFGLSNSLADSTSTDTLTRPVEATVAVSTAKDQTALDIPTSATTPPVTVDERSPISMTSTTTNSPSRSFKSTISTSTTTASQSTDSTGARSTSQSNRTQPVTRKDNSSFIQCARRRPTKAAAVSTTTSRSLNTKNNPLQHGPRLFSSSASPIDGRLLSSSYLFLLILMYFVVLHYSS